ATPQELVLAPGRADLDGRAPVTAELSGASPTERRYDVAAAAPTTVVLDLFYHPALVARVDGEPVPARPTGDDGLMAVDLPSGRPQLAVGPAATPIESAGLAVSAAAAALCLAVGLAGGRGRRAAAATTLLAATAIWPAADA